MFNPLTPKILTVNSLFLLLLNSLQTSYENLLEDQDKNFFLMCEYSHQLFARKHMDISQGEVTCWSLLGVKGLNGPLQN